MIKAVLVSGDDWEALYVDGKCVAQCYCIDAFYMLQLAEENDFTFSQFKSVDASGEDCDECYDSGGFPEELEDFINPPK